MKIYPAFALQELGITDWTMDGSPTSEAEFLSMFKKRLSDGTFTSDASQFGVTWSQVKTKLDEMNTAEPIKLMREERDKRLTSCDWVVTMHKELGTNIPDAWKTYRQALRDLPASSSPKLDNLGNLDMSSVTWPTSPS